MTNKENNYQEIVNGETYKVYEKTKNGIQSLYVEGKLKFQLSEKTIYSNFIGKEIKTQRGETMNFEIERNKIIKDFFQNENSTIYKFQKARLEKGLPMLGCR